jgi:hypothetical protein
MLAVSLLQACASLPVVSYRILQACASLQEQFLSQACASFCESLDLENSVKAGK